MARSLNKATLIGNLTRDPELRYTPQGTAVCTFGLATNRQWTIDSGEKKEDVEFHRIVAWNKLAEICAQLLAKGRKVFVEGRLQTRRWTGQDGQERMTTEIVISEMIILDPKGTTPEAMGGTESSGADDFDIPVEDIGDEKKVKKTKPAKKKKKPAPKKAKAGKKKKSKKDDDIPF